MAMRDEVARIQRQAVAIRVIRNRLAAQLGGTTMAKKAKVVRPRVVVVNNRIDGIRVGIELQRLDLVICGRGQGMESYRSLAAAKKAAARINAELGLSLPIEEV